MNKIFIVADGACSGNPGPAGVGITLEYNGRMKKISKYIGHGTNNIAELMSIKLALEEIKVRNIPVEIKTDSQYCIGILSQNWKANANQQLVAETRRLCAEFDEIVFVKVKGHSGHAGNDIVDKLAVAAYQPYLNK